MSLLIRLAQRAALIDVPQIPPIPVTVVTASALAVQTPAFLGAIQPNGRPSLAAAVEALSDEPTLPWPTHPPHDLIRLAIDRNMAQIEEMWATRGADLWLSLENAVDDLLSAGILAN